MVGKWTRVNRCKYQYLLISSFTEKLLGSQMSPMKQKKCCILDWILGIQDMLTSGVQGPQSLEYGVDKACEGPQGALCCCQPPQPCRYAPKTPTSGASLTSHSKFLFPRVSDISDGNACQSKALDIDPFNRNSTRGWQFLWPQE